MRYDITIIGGGLAGMIAMLSFAERGFKTLGLEQQKDQKLDPLDLRSTALLMPSIELLKSSNLWERLQTLATPLDVMEIVDAKQTPHQSVRFSAQEIKQDHFGYNFLNAKLHNELRRAIKTHPNIELHFGETLEKLMPYETHIALKTNKSQYETRLLIGADGRHSKTRELAGIKAEYTPLDQMAQVFTITHALPHGNISTEVHLEGGPFTLVPMQDVNGEHASAVVWMDRPEAIKARAALSEDEFNQALNIRSAGLRGQAKRASALGAFPMASLKTSAFAHERVALIGEAAHVVPPIGAQGLNMSIGDIRSLIRICERGGLEDASYLQSWSQSRSRETAIRSQGIALLNAVSIGDIKQSDLFRRWGLNLLEKQSPLKSGLMRLGLST